MNIKKIYILDSFASTVTSVQMYWKFPPGTLLQCNGCWRDYWVLSFSQFVTIAVFIFNTFSTSTVSTPFGAIISNSRIIPCCLNISDVQPDCFYSPRWWLLAGPKLIQNWEVSTSLIWSFHLFHSSTLSHCTLHVGTLGSEDTNDLERALASLEVYNDDNTIHRHFKFHVDSLADVDEKLEWIVDGMIDYQSHP